MPYNGSGTFTLPAGNPVVTGTTISSVTTNNTNNDIANGLSNAVTRNGQSPPTANLPMGNFKLTGLATATAVGDALSYGNEATVTDLTATGTITGTFTGTFTGAWAQMPAGTRMPFAQAAAPTGWTQDTTDNATNRMLRVVNTAGNGVGGSASPILNNTVSSHTHTFTGNALGNHTHTDSGHNHGYGPVAFTFAGGSNTQFSMNGGAITSYANISSNSAGTPSGTNSANAGAADWTPRYIDMIICAKN
jgi:hypothetical protein